MVKKMHSAGMGLEDLVLVGAALIFLALILGVFLGFTFIVFILFISHPLVFLAILAGLILIIYLIKYIKAEGFTW